MFKQLSMLNLINYFENKTVISTGYVKTKITQYHTDIKKVPKLRIYVTRKDNFITKKKYVQLNLNKK
jgi:hypothetical protein